MFSWPEIICRFFCFFPLTKKLKIENIGFIISFLQMHYQLSVGAIVLCFYNRNCMCVLQSEFCFLRGELNSKLNSVFLNV